MLYFEDIELNDPQTSASYTIGKEEIMVFAREWDPQPFHTDEEEAKKWPLGLTASSLHSYAISTKLLTTMDHMEPAAVVAGLGVDEMRMPLPVRPGDTLTAVCYISAKRESKSKPDMGIITSTNELKNQNDEVVLSYKTSSLIMKRPQE